MEMTTKMSITTRLETKTATLSEDWGSDIIDKAWNEFQESDLSTSSTWSLADISELSYLFSK